MWLVCFIHYICESHHSIIQSYQVIILMAV